MSELLGFIIEDDDDLSVIFSEALQAAGFKTEIIQSGDRALARLAVTTPDVVVLDLHLPRVAGMDILHQIRADARLVKTRVIVATACWPWASSCSPKSASDWTRHLRRRPHPSPCRYRGT